MGALTLWVTAFIVFASGGWELECDKHHGGIDCLPDPSVRLVAAVEPARTVGWLPLVIVLVLLAVPAALGVRHIWRHRAVAPS